MQIIERTSTVERLKETQRVYWMSLAAGRVDETYIAERIKIGQVHSRIGLKRIITLEATWFIWISLPTY